MQWIDIGCNLSHESFNQDWPQVVDAAASAGVVQLVLTGASLQGSDRALELARQRPGTLFSTAGIHPHLATDFNADAAEHLAALHQHNEVVAVGECGLDYFRDFSPRPAQHHAFEGQLELAIACGKPLFLHQRDAHDDFMAILKPVRDQLGAVVVHCFTDTRRALFDYLDLDCHVGITGWVCDERRGMGLKELIEHIPADRLMLETDAPYLKPRNLRPKVRSHRNEPQWLPWIGGTVAALRRQSPTELAQQTTRNARAFFRLPEPSVVAA